MAKSRDKNKRFERGTSMSLYIRADVSDKLLDWLNSHKEVSTAITDTLEKVVNDEYIHKSVLFEYLDRMRVEGSEAENRSKSVEKTDPVEGVVDLDVEDDDYTDEEPDFGDPVAYNQHQNSSEKNRESTEEEEGEEYIDPDEIDFGEENPFAKKKEKEEPKKKNRGMPRIRSSSFDTHKD